jgi:cytidylate kinase
MKPDAVTKSREIAHAAERQMRAWAHRSETQSSAGWAKGVAPRAIAPFIAISREVGVDATEIATAIATSLSWKMLDRELLDCLAESCHWSRAAMEAVDERPASWFHDTFGSWIDEQIVSQPEYVSRLKRVVLMAAEHESTVFVGRGAQFMLPRHAGLSVRFIAPRKARVEQIVQQRGCSRHDAEILIRDTERGRASFVRRYFHQHVDDAHLYDLVINLEHISREAAVELVLAANKLIASARAN